MSLKENLETWEKLNRDFTDEQWAFCMKMFRETPPIKLFEALVKHYKAINQKIITESLLSDMEENDLTKFENDSVKVVIKQKVSTKTVDKMALLQWLESNGYEDVITEVLSFPKGELKAEDLVLLEEKGLSFTREGSAPPASVKKIITDRLAEGEELPGEDVIAVSYFDMAEVKRK